MTALNTMALADAVLIFQDRAAYDYEDGVIDVLHRKVRVSDDGRWGFGCMGNGWVRPAAEATILKLDFKDAVRLLSDFVRRAVALAESQGDAEPSAAVSIAGWNEGAKEVQGFYAQSWPWNRGEPFEVVRASFMVNPPPAMNGGRFSLTSDDVKLNYNVLGAVEFGRRLMELQRVPLPAGACDVPGWAWKKHAVGGGCDAVIVNRDGARIVTVAEWPDQIGEGPEVRERRGHGPAEILLASAPSNVTRFPSRAERRRAARAA